MVKHQYCELGFDILLCGAEISLEFSEDIEVGTIWEELLTTSKLMLHPHLYLKIKGVCLLIEGS